MKIMHVVCLSLCIIGCAPHNSALDEWMLREGRPKDQPVWQGTMLVQPPENSRPPIAVYYMGRVPLDAGNVQIEAGKLVDDKYVFRPPAGSTVSEVWLERNGDEVAVIAPLPSGCRHLASLMPLAPGTYCFAGQKIQGRYYTLEGSRSTAWTWCGGFH
jgi:hypothetical protein